jgi:hypothetical protein
MYTELKNLNVLGQILLLFAFISIVVILAPPKFSPQTLNCLEFQVHNCIQECLYNLAETHKLINTHYISIKKGKNM